MRFWREQSVDTTAAGVTRLPSLTSLRAVAALAVFTRHASETFFPVGHNSPLTRQGATGVSFFFVLSGFVLTWSARDGDTPADFYRRRVARIYPAYISVLLVTQLALTLRSHAHVAALAANAALVQSWVPMAHIFFGSDMGAWSLGCEAFFYLLFPLVLPWLAGLSWRRRWRVAGGCFGAYLLLALIVRSPQQEHGVGLWLLYVFPVSRFAEFVVGIVVGLAVRQGARPRISFRWAVVGAAAAYAAAGFVPVYLMWVAVTLVPFAALIAAAAVHDAEGKRSWLTHRWLLRAGEWSYAFYLVHISVLAAAHHLAPGLHGGAAAVLASVLTCAAAWALAGALFVVVERPLERRLRGRRNRPVAAAAERLAVA